jgi:RNA recognition motif-containing protein
MADYIFDFTLTGNKYFNGKVLQVSSTNPNLKNKFKFQKTKERIGETLADISRNAVKPVLNSSLSIKSILRLSMRANSSWRLSKGLNGKHEITVNSNLNKYKFLITLIHEISHLVAFENLEEKSSLMVMSGNILFNG